jgi:hypothetical protein
MKNGIPGSAHVGRLGATLLGVYLIAIGVVPYLPPTGISMLVSVLAVVTGIVILIGR